MGGIKIKYIHMPGKKKYLFCFRFFGEVLLFLHFSCTSFLHKRESLFQVIHFRSPHLYLWHSKSLPAGTKRACPFTSYSPHFFPEGMACPVFFVFGSHSARAWAALCPSLQLTLLIWGKLSFLQCQPHPCLW